MAWHKWFVRGLVFTVVASAVTGTLAYQHWTNPAAVRQLVLAQLQKMYPGAQISVGSASLHLFGYILVLDLHVARADDPTGADVVHIPSATLYHDKEKMLDGDLCFRKIELHRPKLRLTRDRDGKWNVQGLAATVKAEQPLPTIVVHEAVVQIEDQHLPAGACKLELTGANLSLINDPLDSVAIDGIAQADLLGKIVLHAAWQRKTNEAAVSIKTTDTPLNDALLARAACLFPSARWQGAQATGKADLQADLAMRPGFEPACSYQVHARIKKAAIRHPELPLPLEEVEAGIRFDGAEVCLESLKARSGAAVLTAVGAARLPAPDQNFTASLRIEHVELNESLGAHLPEKLRPLVALYDPHGQATLQIDLARREGQWAPLPSGQPSRVSFLPEGISACFQRFPYPVRNVTGVVHYTLPSKLIEVDGVGYAHGRPVSVKGHWQGEGTCIDMDYAIAVSDLPIDAALIAALPEPMRETATKFHLGGKVNVQARIQRRPADDKYYGQYHLDLHDGTVLWEEFPYLLVNVSGRVDIAPTHWEFRNFEGAHGDGRVMIDVRSVPADDRHAMPGVYVELVGKNLLLDQELRSAVRTMPALARAWDTFIPSGRVNVSAAIDRRGKEPDDLEVQVDVKGPTLRPGFFPYSLSNFAGHFHLKDQRLDVRRLSAVHDDARWYLDKGSIELHPTGAMYADVPDLQIEQLILDRELIAALPTKVRGAVDAWRCADPLRLKTRLVIAHPGGTAPPDVFWDAQAWFQDSHLRMGVDFDRVTGTLACVGRQCGKHLAGIEGNFVLDRAAVFNQPFHDVQGRFSVKEARPELLHLDLNAPFFDGNITGQVSLDCHDTTRFELSLTASQIDLEKFGRHNLGEKSKLSGLAVGRLFLTGIGSDPDTLDGQGSFDVPNGKLYDLPFLLDLIKFLGLRWPDRTLFEELHAQYAIRRRRATIENLELFGNAVSFTGKGGVNLDGTDFQLDLYPSWARMEQLLPSSMRAVPPTVSKNFLTVEARGNITGSSKDVKFTKKPMPVIVDPLLNLRNRLIGNPAAETRRAPELTSAPALMPPPPAPLLRARP